MAVANFETKDVNFELIKMEAKVGGHMEDSMLVKGVIVKDDKKLHVYKKETFEKVVNDVKAAGATMAIRQWGPNDEELVKSREQ